MFPPYTVLVLKWNPIFYLHKGVKTGDDAATLCKNLVNFGAVTLEITFVIYVPFYGYEPKIVL